MWVVSIDSAFSEGSLTDDGPELIVASLIANMTEIQYTATLNCKYRLTALLINILHLL